MLEVRRAGPGDVRSIVEMWRSLMKEQLEIARRMERGRKEELRLAGGAWVAFARYVRSQTKSLSGLVLIAEVDGKPAGFAIAMIRRNIPVFRLRKYALITDLYVKKKFRGLGLASRFRERIVSWSRERRVGSLRLNVLVENKRAIAVYKRWGMEPFMVNMRMKV